MNFVKYRGDLILVKINILKIRNAPGEKLTFNVSKQLDEFEINGQHFCFLSPVEVSGEIVNQNNFFQVKGMAKAVVSTNCVNCLEAFELKLQGSLDEVYAKLDSEQFPDLASEMIDFDGDIINIEPEVLKALLLELPIRLVCSDNCRGLCQQCGSNLNVNQCNCQNEDIDPRLAVLKKLQQ